MPCFGLETNDLLYLSKKMKQYFYLKLVPPRPDFAMTMSPEELEIMQQHVQYWQGYLQKGMVVVYGPVMDPAGVFGIAVVSVDDENELHEMMGNDPAVKVNRYEYYPMRAVVAAG